MLFRGIKHQVDKGPVDSVTGKAKYTLNDNRLLREDVEYRPLVSCALGRWTCVWSAPSVSTGFWCLSLDIEPVCPLAACWSGHLFISCGRNTWPPAC